MSKKTCFDLRPWAKEHRYKWRYEDGHGAGEEDAEWFVEVLCKYGLIYPKGENVLLAYATGGVKRRVREIALAHHQWDGPANEVFRFDAARLDDVAVILKPHTRRKLSPEVREKATARLKAFREGRESSLQIGLQKKQEMLDQS